MADEIERSVAAENPKFKCKHCGSGDLWYTTGETYDGAYDTYNYHCHACTKQWRVVAETD